MPRNTSDRTKIALSILQNADFEIESGQGEHWQLKKSFRDGTLIANINTYYSSVNVYFSGVGIKQDRTVEYTLGGEDDESKKLIDRLKRLVKNARNAADIRAKNQVKKDASYKKISTELARLGINSRQKWGGDIAYITINGYEISVNSKMETRISIGNEKKDVDIKTALAIITLMPTHIPYTDDEA